MLTAFVAGVEAECRINVFMDICGIETPATGLEGKFSLRFCAALALAGEDTARTDTYSDAKVNDAALNAILTKTSVTPKDDMQMKVAEVTVHTRAGVVHQASYDVGIPAHDLADQWRKLECKFRSTVEPSLGIEKASQIIGAVRALHTAENVSTLLAGCA